MPSRTISTQSEFDDFIRGLTLFGTGGGGQPAVGHRYITDLVADGKAISWVDYSEIPDDAWTCCPFGMGSIAPADVLSQTERARLGYGPRVVSHPFQRAVEELASYAGVNVGAIVAFEIGAANSTAPLDAAARLGIALVDGDYCGRAVPEMTQISASLAGKTFWPAAVADPWGNVLIIKQAASPAIAEAVGKSLSMVTKRPDPSLPCAHAGFLISGEEMKRIVVPGTLSRALAVGTAIREARERQADPVGAAATVCNGRILFAGTVTAKDWESREGYMYGTTTIRGEDEFAGDEMRIWFKNENHIAWRGETVIATSPDLISIIGRDDGEPTINTYVNAGDRVAVLGIPADPPYRSERGMALLGPRHFGFDLDYVPVDGHVERELSRSS